MSIWDQMQQQMQQRQAPPAPAPAAPQGGALGGGLRPSGLGGAGRSAGMFGASQRQAPQFNLGGRAPLSMPAQPPPPQFGQAAPRQPMGQQRQLQRPTQQPPPKPTRAPGMTQSMPGNYASMLSDERSKGNVELSSLRNRYAALSGAMGE